MEYEQELIIVLAKRNINDYDDFLQKWFKKGKVDKQYLLKYHFSNNVKQRIMIEKAIMENENMAFYEKAHSNKWLLEFDKSYEGWK